MSVKQKHDTPSIIRNEEKYTNDPIAIANTFNNFFTSIAETVQSKIRFSNTTTGTKSSTQVIKINQGNVNSLFPTLIMNNY